MNSWFLLPQRYPPHLQHYTLYSALTHQQSKMPKKPNVKKAASAQYQNIKALAEAASGAEGMVYLAVEKLLGNRYFLCITSDGHQVMAEPRKLFTKGSMRVERGGIVVAQAPVMPAWKAELVAQQRAEHMAACKRAKQSGGNAPAADLGLPYEIVGVISERSEAKRLVKTRVMPQSILDMALAAEAGPAYGGGGAAEAKPLLADDLEFMTTEEAARQAKQEMLAAMTAEERADYATRTQLVKRIQMSGGGGSDAFQNSGLDLEEFSGICAKDDGHHASRGMKQARAAADAKASIQQRLAALLSGSKKASADVAVGDVLVEEDEELAAGGGGAMRYKQLRPKKTEEEKAAQRAAMAAEARSKAELEDLVSGLLGPSQEEVAAAAAAAERARLAEVAKLQAELAAMGAVEDWEEAADAAHAWNGRSANGLSAIRTPPDSDEELPSTAGREQEVCLDDL